MSDLFFYGTLRHVPLLERVLGHGADTLKVSDAALADHSVRAVQGEIFPMIQPETGSSADGLLVQGLSDVDLERLAYYEGGFDYGLQNRMVTTREGAFVQSQVFFPEPGKWVPGEEWSLTDWVEGWGDIVTLAAEEEMAYFGRIAPEVMLRSTRAIQTRAWAKLLARKRRTGEPRDIDKDVIVHRHKRAYVDYFGMEEIDLQHRQHDGTMGPVLHRASLLQGSAVAVLPYDPVRDRVLIVEQFRPPVFLIDDPEPWLWEAVAGMIDPGETPEHAAHREVMEEAGVSLKALEYAGGAYSSGGSSTGYMCLYVGLGDLTETTTTGGLASEGEDIRTEILPFEAFMERVDGNDFKDLPLLTLAHWLARHRDRLRA
ncbi:NUDIX domain-containing protein [Ruegeria sp.]|uniref:NUDIX domain-containing protein n=1 Tax=Ruegeria sp. TaxID=1879320 RepID=UPI003B593E4B